MKKELYTTAKALIACQWFEAGEVVKVEYQHTAANGVDWYLCNGVVVYPHHHLSRFCI